METILVVQGKSLSEYLDEVASVYIYGNEGRVLGNRKVVEAEELVRYVRERYGEELTRGEIYRYRGNEWFEGEDYWSVEVGASRAFRYDYGRCLMVLDRDFGSEG